MNKIGLECGLGDNRFIALRPNVDANGAESYIIACRRSDIEHNKSSVVEHRSDGEVRSYLCLTPESLRALALLIEVYEPGASFALAESETESGLSQSAGVAGESPPASPVRQPHPASR